MDIHELVIQTRSYRRFKNNEKISLDTLLSWVDTARLTMSSVNIQPLKYYISYKDETNAVIRPHTRWAGLLKDWDGPEDDENPAAYILVFVDSTIKNATTERFAKDIGIVSQTIMLRAMEDGYGGCMIGSFDPEISNLLEMPAEWKLGLVLAFGKISENVILEELDDSGDSSYYRDSADNHHVPKRKLCDIVKY